MFESQEKGCTENISINSAYQILNFGESYTLNLPIHFHQRRGLNIDFPFAAIAITKTRPHALRKLGGNKPVARCQQTCCRLAIKTCYRQASFKLLQQVVTRLQVTRSNNCCDLMKLIVARSR